jgi:galactonate dehydratase
MGMKITAIESVRLAQFPQQLWVRVHTDDGVVGLGETCIGPATVEAHLHETVAPHLIGKDPTQIDRHSRTLYDLFVGYGGTGAETRGNSAVNVALWDITGQASGLPLHDLLGGRTRESIRIYNTCAGYQYGRGNAGALLASDRASAGDRGIPVGMAAGPYEDLQAALDRPGELALDLLEQGITGMKIWPFDEYARESGGGHISSAELAAGRLRMEKIRDAVGNRMDVMVELHALWNLPTASRIARATEDLEPYWFEDAVKADDLRSAAAFAASTRIPVATGETLAGRWAFSDLIDRQAVQIVMFDIGWVGGLSEAKKIATLAEAHALPIAPHDCTGPVVLTASTHLAVNAPNALVQETVRAYYTGWYPEVVTEIPQIENGRIKPPSGAGLGTALQPGIASRDGASSRITRAADL